MLSRGYSYGNAARGSTRAARRRDLATVLRDSHLGAQSGKILWLIARQGIGLTLLGLAGGLTAGFWTTQFLSTLLVGVTPTDPMTFGGIAGFFFLIALVACLVPAHRATRVDPILSLRHE